MESLRHPLNFTQTRRLGLSRSVSLCRTLSHSVALCRAMSHSVALCRAMSRYVALCRAMSRYVSLHGWDARIRQITMNVLDELLLLLPPFEFTIRSLLLNLAVRIACSIPGSRRRDQHDERERRRPLLQADVG